MNNLNVIQLCSGGGTTFESSAKRMNSGELGDIRSVAMLASEDGIGAIEKARVLEIPYEILKNPRDSQEILNLARRYKANVVSMNGYMKLLPKEVIETLKLQGIILLNQHPSCVRKNKLDFGGDGMYGARPTAARVLYLLSIGAEGEDVFTESTVQHVAPKFDEGSSVGVMQLAFPDELEKFKSQSGIIGLEHLDYIDFTNLTDPTVSVMQEFTEKIQKALLKVEHQNVADVFERLGNGEIELKIAEEYYESLVGEKDIDKLVQAKRRAIQLFPRG